MININLGTPRPQNNNQVGEQKLGGSSTKEAKFLEQLDKHRKDFSDMDLPGLCFKELHLGTELDFSGANLKKWKVKELTLDRNCDFMRANLEGWEVDELTIGNECNLIGANLNRWKVNNLTIGSECNFIGANLEGWNVAMLTVGSKCSFSDARLQSWKIERLKVDDSDFCNTDWSGATLKDASATGVNMKGAKFANAYINGQFHRCRFVEADLSGATLNCPHFEDCNFDRADLQGINVHLGTFERVSFDQVRVQCPGTFSDCKFNKVSWKFENPKRPHLVFWNARFTEADFSHTDLWGSKFAVSSFIGPTDFEHCKGFTRCVNCIFVKVNLLPLWNQPDSMWAGRDFSEVLSNFYRSKRMWQSIIHWEQGENSSPVLSLNLENYKWGFEVFDSVERKYIREKVASILETRRDLATPEAVSLFEEIKKLEDANPARQPTEGKYVSLENEIVLAKFEYTLKHLALKEDKAAEFSFDSTTVSSGNRSRNGSESSDSGKVANSFQLFG